MTKGPKYIQWEKIVSSVIDVRKLDSHLQKNEIKPFTPYTTTAKTIALTKRTFDGKVMSLLFNRSRLVKEQASFNFMAALTICSDFGAQKNKVSHCFQFPHLFAMK